MERRATECTTLSFTDNGRQQFTCMGAIQCMSFVPVKRMDMSGGESLFDAVEAFFIVTIIPIVVFHKYGMLAAIVTLTVITFSHSLVE